MHISQFARFVTLFTLIHILGVYSMDDWESWSLQELEQQMSPSRWNPSKTPQQVIDEYIRVSVQETKHSLEAVPHQQNISYGSKPSQKYDLYGTDLSKDSPIFIFLHGGYWQEGSKDISGGTGAINHRNGIRTIVIGYTLAPTAKITDMENEIIEALSAISTKYSKARLIISGHSAGGQLAAHLLHQDSTALSNQFYDQLVGLLLISGVYDLRPLVKTYVNDPLNMTSNEAEALSPLRTSSFNPKIDHGINIMLIVGEMDSPEFKRQTQDYYDKLKARYSKSSYWKSPADDHFTIVQNAAIGTTSCGQNVQNFLKTCNSSMNEPEARGGGSSSRSLVLPLILFVAMILI